ncbi:short-chain dehydrogenase/reductase (SDR) family protein [Scheffersomyces stipitis CBS 6054]|uniref:Short-chain dehydrogenase/reductase (SDR) family protein n=1 Tax=Scheffersomyces stipitis (strain ATCC 58785 / CBS 6054 / NBRC 10063 / NRRL Y-11545) TaxID=322104 RepID=A3LXZ8_PICST|nr:short-chain dehydrogenase/reductase (SDR) family protein [Scheffersomyces stipitis CBS 6054]ABN67548.1 short-chain dehydrogenase/reductase (SDR) family protein [Scheffersomyces stipitis CBS 6054]KAG2732094.1 hypothetical protein G9P44_004511 [Scheffersomyces stipitis]
MAGNFKSEKDISGKVAVITGGTTNLGGETAKELASLGVNLFLHYRSSSEVAKKFQEELKAKYPKLQIEIYQAPLKAAADLTKLFEAAKKAFPQGIDIAINNIGKVVKKPLVEVTEEEFDELDLVNHKVAFFFLKEAALNLNNNGRIVTIVTSLLAAYTPFYSPYQGTKAPVEFYTKALSKELGEKGITVNNVAPGPMDTSFLHTSETPEAVQYLASVGLNGRLTELPDIVPIVRFLVSEGAWITGQTIFASGGFTAR